ncbi:transcriptional coactivator PipX [Alkalinema sp. FACHB-956]|uniref:transcriptional coactivator PipX n=1 Tax=Alkalinema sp. FACHB-956 TaxID=2692768 RepID=UPI001681D75A|nr:PipX family protein [Alkalinema sp. FACHB-956]MBD2329015.1 PipX family protein [Alkalinema sp. FACHB-956]
MGIESYLNHPTFGLLFRVCLIEEHQELFTTLYAQRLFFIVSNGSGGLQFDSISRADAKILVENRMRWLRRQGTPQEYTQLVAVHRQTFQ